MAQELPEGTVTVLFTDCEGSTDLTTRLGDDAARDVLRACDELVRQQVARHRGQEVKHTGDGLMVAFTSARRAVVCAVDIQKAIAGRNRREPERAVRVRIGINTGEVIRENADLFGATVNAAKRIADQAAAGEILISETAKGVLGEATTVQLEDRGEAELKGFPRPIRLYLVSWEEEAVTAAGPRLPERTPFVGREAERAELRRCLEQVLSGQGALVMIGGEPGVGKTRLAEELLLEARQRGVLSLTGHCYDMEGAPPYIPFVETLEATARIVPGEAFREALGDAAPEVAKLMPGLRRLFPDIPPPLELPPEQERRYLFNSFQEFLERASKVQPLLLVLEDLHWGDDATLLLLQHIAQQLAQMPLFIVGTYRDVALDAGRPLATALDELTRRRLTQRIALKRLPEADTGAMLRALSGREPPHELLQVVYAETEGNPFFVEEVWRHLSGEGKLLDAAGRWRSDLQVSELDVPDSVRLAITRRLQRVSDSCQRALTSAAVIGRGFSFELLEALGDTEPDALLDAIDEAERAHLITSTADGPEARFTFAHELIRQTLVSGLSFPRRQRLHLRVAEAVEKTYPRSLEEHAGDLAHHLYQAGAAAQPEKTVRYLTLAGEQAMAASAFEEAVHDYKIALQTLETMEEPDEERRCDLLLALSDALWGVTDEEEAESTALLAMSSARALRDPERMGHAALRVGGLLEANFARPNETAVSALTEALEALGEEDSAVRTRVLARLAREVCQGLSDREWAKSLSQQAIETARRVGDAAALTDALAISVYWLRPPPENIDDRLAAAAELLPLLAEAGDKPREATWRHTRIGALLDLGDIPGVDAEIEALARNLEEMHSPVWIPTMFRAMRALMEGRFADAERLSREALTVGVEVRRAHARGLFVSQLFNLRYLQGSFGEADVEYTKSQAGQGPPYPIATECYLAFVCSQLGREADTREVFERLAAGDFSEVFRRERWVILFASLLSEACAFLRDQRRARMLYEKLLPCSAINLTINPYVFFGPVSRYLGLLATTMEHWEDAARHFEDALEMNARMGARPWLAIAQLDYARMLLARHKPGDREKARDLLTEAIAICGQIGMPGHLEVAEEMMKETGGPPKQPAPVYPDRLTEREVEVLRLIAAGKSNQQIADELVISLNTVIRHVSNIFAKTGVANRVEAATYASRHTLLS